MKVIHWTPKENKNLILENGIKITNTWVSCSILTPFKNLNKWWLDFILNDKEYVGCIFELIPEDFPLVHSHWNIDSTIEYDDNFEVTSTTRHSLDDILNNNPKDVYYNLKELKKDYEETIVWRIGNSVDESSYISKDGTISYDTKKIIKAGYTLIKQNSKKAIKDFFDNPDFMEFVFEDYELLLFKDIALNRIEKIIKPNTNYKYSDLLDEIKSKLC